MTTGAKQAGKRRATTPRRPATGRTSGNGHGPAAPLAPPPEPQVTPPERYEYEPTTTPQVPEPAPAPPKVEHPYGDKAIYTFVPAKVKHPGDSMEPIVVPHITTLDADVEFFWELDDLDPMHQAFRYMKRADIPREVQRRVVRLPEDEMARFLNGWFLGVLIPQGVGPPGES